MKRPRAGSYLRARAVVVPAYGTLAALTCKAVAGEGALRAAAPGVLYRRTGDCANREAAGAGPAAGGKANADRRRYPQIAAGSAHTGAHLRPGYEVLTTTPKTANCWERGP